MGDTLAGGQRPQGDLPGYAPAERHWAVARWRPARIPIGEVGISFCEKRLTTHSGLSQSPLEVRLALVAIVVIGLGASSAYAQFIGPTGPGSRDLTYRPISEPKKGP